MKEKKTPKYIQKCQADLVKKGRKTADEAGNNWNKKREKHHSSKADYHNDPAEKEAYRRQSGNFPKGVDPPKGFQ
jgi:hypothetical protein